MKEAKVASMKIFMFAPVYRKDSLNKKLIRLAHEYVESLPGYEAELREFNDFKMPLYDGDIEVNEGIPQGILELAEKIKAADAIIFSSPEYNGGIPGVFKNAIDWLSRMNPVPVEGKQFFLMTATPGSLAGARGNHHTRWPLQILFAHVYPKYFGVPRADQAFDENGKFKDKKHEAQMQKLLLEFLTYASRKETPFDNLDVFIEEQKHSHPSQH
ncbi:FMN-dependent NADPH-azoreductase [compost metagenome]